MKPARRSEQMCRFGGRPIRFRPEHRRRSRGRRSRGRRNRGRRNRGRGVPFGRHLLVRYLLGTRDVWLVMEPQSPGGLWLQTFVDADWAADVTTRRSTSGGVVTLCGAAVLTYSRTQPVIALSSGESELYAIGSGVAESIGLASTIQEVTGQIVPVSIMSDSSAGISRATRPGLGRMRHIDIRFLFLQKVFQQGKAVLRKVKGTANCADLLTKVLDRKQIMKYADLIGLTGFPTTPGTQEQSDKDTVATVTSGSHLVHQLLAAYAVLQQIVVTKADDRNALPPADNNNANLIVKYELSDTVDANPVLFRYVLLFGIILAIVSIFVCGWRCHARSTLTRGWRRTMSVQAPCTYNRHAMQPRFRLLPDAAWGAWPAELHVV